MFRAGQGSAYSGLFLEHGVVAFLGAIPSGISKGELLSLMASQHPQYKPGNIKSWGSQLYRFLEELKAGDTVVTYDQEQRTTSARSARGPTATRPFPTRQRLHGPRSRGAGKRRSTQRNRPGGRLKFKLRQPKS
jgi:hypothetical protein